MSAVQSIKKRADFLAVRGGVKATAPGFLIEAKRRKPPTSPPKTFPASEGPRFGLTITKKLGNAVRRNRIRRRLRAAILEASPSLTVAGFDYVIVARPPAFDRTFDALVADLKKALQTIHTPRGEKRRQD